MQFGYNPYQFEAAKARNQELLNEVSRIRFAKQVALASSNSEGSRRRFFLMYHVRRILFRIAPKLASRLLL